MAVTDSAPADLLLRLTNRELQCLRLAALPMQAKEIAAELNLRPKTVESYLDSARVKLGVSSRTAAVRLLREAEAGPVITPQAPHRVSVDSDLPPPATSIGEGQVSVTGLHVREELAVYQAGTLGRRTVPLPVPTRQRPSNDLSRSERSYWIAALVAVSLLGVGAFLAGLTAVSALVTG